MADNKFSVVLEKVGNQPLKTTKILCGALGLGLAAAKTMVDKVPATVATGLDRDKAIALRNELESLGNTVSIPGMEEETEAPVTEKTSATKKQTTKTSAPSPLTATAASNEEFNAIFGGSTAQKATTVKTKKDVKSMSKTTPGKASAASNDEFDAIFGSNESK